MKCPGLTGLVLLSTLALVYSMPTVTTTTRYTSFEGHDSFPITTQNLNTKDFLNSFSSNSSHSSVAHVGISKINIANQSENDKESKDDQFLNKILLEGFKNNSKFIDNSERSRKLKKHSSKTQPSLSGYIKIITEELVPLNKTMTVSTVNRLPTKNKNNTRIAPIPIKLDTSKISNTKVTSNNVNTFLLNKRNITVVAAKVPVNLKLEKVATTSKTTNKLKFKLGTVIPVQEKITTARPTPRHTRKPARKTSNKPRIKSTTPRSKHKPKPTIHKIITKWSDAPDLSEIKQDWYEEGVPYPNPNPEISSYSPPVSISDLSSISPLSSSNVNNEIYPSPAPEIISYSPSNSISDVPSLIPDIPLASSSTSNPTTAVGNPLNVFNLDMVPVRTADTNAAGFPCPTVHISSSMLGSRQQRQDCSDLNLVINSHYHQNQNPGGGGTRNPAINTYQQDALADVPVESIGEALADPIGAADSAVVAADPGVANTGGVAPQAAVPAAGGTGGSGGSGGSGSNGGGLQFPDLKHMFEAIGYIWNALKELAGLLSFLKNPYLYIVPAALFFTLGFLAILTLFPWWIPLLVLYVSVKTKSKPKETVSFYHHIHKPVRHADGWFWNHQTKTWQNVQDYVHRKDGQKRIDNVEDQINTFPLKYRDDNENLEFWRRRKHNVRSTPKDNATHKLSNQLAEVNATSLDMVYDVRTPPKIRQQQKEKMKIKEEMETSHAGVAIPIDADSLEMEESTKKMNFYKIEKPTTNSGLSTWILLSGQTTMTPKPFTRKPVIKPVLDEQPKKNVTVISNEKPNRIVKPIFKRRTPTTTTITTSIPISTTPVSSTTSKGVKETTKLTKIKASVLSNAVNKKNHTSANNNTKIISEHPISTTTESYKKNITVKTTTISSVNSTAPTIEAKDGEADLPNDSDKKKKGTNKRKKNKNKRRKPEKNSNNTSIARPTKVNKQNPLGTQLYNYLSREIMPTVGVGLVGLVVTAGLASYFLFPFGAARRNYDIDRRDKEGSYYYGNEYSGGIPEEEAIGKVIAGMPTNTLFDNSYKAPNTRNTYSNGKYRLVDRKAEIQPQYYASNMQGSVENVPIETKDTYDGQNYHNDNYERITYTKDVDSTYSTIDDKRFVVGNVPKETLEEITPASVPEHGPRNLKLNLEEIHAEEPTFIVSYPQQSAQNPQTNTVPAHGPRSLRIRRKRSEIPNDIDNEIVPSDIEEIGVTFTTEDVTEASKTTTTTTIKPQTTTLKVSTTTKGSPEKVSIIDLLRDLIHFKAKLGLQAIQNVTQSFSNYISKVQSRLNVQENSRKCKD